MRARSIAGMFLIASGCVVVQHREPDAAVVQPDAFFLVDAPRPDAWRPDAWAPDTGPPDAWTPPPDAWSPPPDAWSPPDAGCTSATGSTPITVHVVEPDPSVGGTRPLVGAAVLAESACGGASVETTTDASGDATLDLADGGAPWTVTIAMAGHTVVSVLEASAPGFLVGDVRLDPIATPAAVMHRASGVVTGASGVVRVDTYDADSVLAPPAAPSFAMTFYTGGALPTPPFPIFGVERDATGRATSFVVTAETARPAADVTGIVLAMPGTPPTPLVSHVRVTLPTSGVVPGVGATVRDLGAVHALFDLPGAPSAATGSATITMGTPIDLELRRFAGAYEVNLSGLEVTSASATIDVVLTDTSDHDVVVPAVDLLDTSGDALGTLSAVGASAGYDVLVVDVSASAGRPSWRVLARASTGDVTIPSMPHLPSSIVRADVGLGGATARVRASYVRMAQGAAWSTESLAGPAWQTALLVRTPERTVSTDGR
jgi:hypothetical protein